MHSFGIPHWLGLLHFLFQVLQQPKPLQPKAWLLADPETNATSTALSGVLADVDSVRNATLQNCAAIDFLLLAHGHGYQDY